MSAEKKRETVEEFLARGGVINQVCPGGADKIIALKQKEPWRLNSRFHFGGEPLPSEVVFTIKQMERAQWAAHSHLNKSGCKTKKRKEAK